MASVYNSIVKDLFLDVVWEILYFPIWWYSRGLKKAAVFCWQKIRGGWRALAIVMILRNFFKPMYGQRGWDAYVLSIAGHSFHLCWRFCLMLIWFVFWLVILLAWLVLPFFIIWQIIV